jgi:hypothetical protein
VGVRKRKDGDLGTLSLEAFIARLKGENDAKVR